MRTLAALLIVSSWGCAGGSRIDGGRADVWLPPATRVEDLPEMFASGVKIER
jgi:hypothetical protein